MNPLYRPVYMVDDEEDDRRLFLHLLRETGLPHPAETFAQGEQLIDRLIAVLRGAPLPLVCCIDVRMPGLSGFDVLRWIRCQHGLDAMPVAMLSASESEAHLEEARYHGAQCYLAKFPSAEELRGILTEAERVAAASTSSPFRLAGNLLASPGRAAC